MTSQSNTQNSNLNYNKVSYELIATPDEIVSGFINPFNKVNKLMTKNTVQNILKKYKIFQNINNLDLYQDALVHESYTINKIKDICSRDNVKPVKSKRCPNGMVRNKITKECVPKQNNNFKQSVNIKAKSPKSPKSKAKIERCPKGTRRNPKTLLCEAK